MLTNSIASFSDMEIGQATKDWLKQPTFDSSQWKDEEILLFLQQMFLELDLTNRFSIRLPILRNFLYEVYKNYNEVPFHNFRHCFCVAQMVSTFISVSASHTKKLAELISSRFVAKCCIPPSVLRFFVCAKLSKEHGIISSSPYFHFIYAVSMSY